MIVLAAVLAIVGAVATWAGFNAVASIAFIAGIGFMVLGILKPHDGALK